VSADAGIGGASPGPQGFSARDAGFALLAALLFAAPYALAPLLADGVGKTWRFSAATLLILIAVVVWERGKLRASLARLGVAMPKRHALMAAGLFVIGFLVVQAGLDRLAASLHFERLSPRLAFSASQVVHQELVLHGLLLGALLKRGVGPLPLALGTALLFSALHWSFFGLFEGQWLGMLACSTLLLVGLAGNWLYLATRHIGYALAVHLAWNLARFASGYRLAGRRIGEAESFEVIEGSLEVALAAAILALASAAFAHSRGALWGRTSLQGP